MLGRIAYSISVLLVLFLGLESVPVRGHAQESLAQSARVILEKHCVSCHGATQMGGLDLREREALLTGGTRGPALVPGDPEASVLYQALLGTDDLAMPLGQDPLSDEEVEIIHRWIAGGAPWEEAGTESNTTWWAFRSPETPPVPTVKNREWVRNPIDAFILRRLEENGLKPERPTDRLTLLRRMKFDLHGLPPTEHEIREFLSDIGAGALERLVERLLASPRYGETWGRHWLDVARFADSSGLMEDLTVPHAYRYRDYVIDSFNQDIPYDQFVREQISGDLLPGVDPNYPNVRGIVATGFLALGPRPIAQQDKTLMIYDVVDEQIDTFSKAFLGLTVACARCHDHKFDSISTRDYYSLASIFASTRSFEEVIPQDMKPPYVSSFYFEPIVPQQEFARYREHQDRIKGKETQIEATIEMDLFDRARTQFYPQLVDYMLASRQVYGDGQGLDQVAQRTRLDAQVLERFVKNLDPDVEFRPYLQEWHRASGSQLRKVAQRHKKLFFSLAEKWAERMSEWQREVALAVQQRTKPPKKPANSDDFVTVEERFFYDVNDEVFIPPKEEREEALSADAKSQVAELRKALEELKEAAPAVPPLASAVAEGEIVEQRVFVRGNHKNLGDPVPKAFPAVLTLETQPSVRQGSGRKELGEWLSQPSHPLTSRVMVNRIWQWHFGEGLVRTPNNWGTTGQKPTHPELLDYLATEFARRGWSIKSVHRLILSSNTYRMSSRLSEDRQSTDPANHLWSHFNRRRLRMEEIRDSYLALDGALDLTMGGSLIPIVMDYGQKGPEQEFDPKTTRRRSVYVPVIRNKLAGEMRLFDFANSVTSCERRTESTTSLQALYMMNSDNLYERSRAFAHYLLADGNYDDSERVQRAYRMTLTREPSPEEIGQGLDYIEKYPAAAESESPEESRLDSWQSFCRILMTSNEFNYVN